MTLTPLEAGKLLAATREFDYRHWDEQTALAWAATINPTVTLDAAYRAIRAHYSTSSERITVADINRFAADERRRLLAAAGPADFPNGLTQKQEREYRSAWQRAVLAGATREQASAITDRELGYHRGLEITAPPTVRDRLDEYAAGLAAKRAELEA